MDLPCAQRRLLLLPGVRFAGNRWTRVLHDLLMIPKADVNDAAFPFRPAFRGVLSTHLLTPSGVTSSLLTGNRRSCSPDDDDDGTRYVLRKCCTLQPLAFSIDRHNMFPKLVLWAVEIVRLLSVAAFASKGPHILCPCHFPRGFLSFWVYRKGKVFFFFKKSGLLSQAASFDSYSIDDSPRQALVNENIEENHCLSTAKSPKLNFLCVGRLLCESVWLELGGSGLGWVGGGGGGRGLIYPNCEVINM